MTNHFYRAASLIVLSFFQNGSLLSQPATQGYSIGGSIGVFVYQGDLAPSAAGSFKTMRPGINLWVSKGINPVFSWRANLAFSQLRGDDAKYDHPAYRQQRNFNFRSSVAELSGLLVWHPLSKKDKKISPYLFGGAGISFVNIKRDWSGFNAAYFGGDGSAMVLNLSADQEHQLPRSLPVIPLGAGIRYALSPRIAVTAESSYRLVFTDYLDGFSRAANTSQNDHYHSTSVGVVYSLGNKDRLGCPVLTY